MMTMMITTVTVMVTAGTNLPACGWASMNKYKNWDFSIRDETKTFGSRKYFYPLFHFVQQLNEKGRKEGKKGRNGRKKGDEEWRREGGKKDSTVESKMDRESRELVRTKDQKFWSIKSPPHHTHTYTFSHHSIHFQVYNTILLFSIKRWPPPTNHTL